MGLKMWRSDSWHKATWWPRIKKKWNGTCQSARMISSQKSKRVVQRTSHSLQIRKFLTAQIGDNQIKKTLKMYPLILKQLVRRYSTKYFRFHIRKLKKTSWTKPNSKKHFAYTSINQMKLLTCNISHNSLTKLQLMSA